MTVGGFGNHLNPLFAHTIRVEASGVVRPGSAGRKRKSRPVEWTVPAASMIQHQLLHGDLVAALHFNAMFILSLPLFAWLGLRILRSRTGAEASMPTVRPVWLWLYLATWIAFGVLRNVPGVFTAFAAHVG